MAKIFPFKGILYNRDRIPDVSKVTAPPYDVISEGEQDKYYRADEYNIIRLILGKENPDDGEQNNKYTRAAGFLRSWLEEGKLVRDNEPSIYFYSQEYNMEGERKLQKGFICILRLEEFSENGTVLPHEKTLAGAKKDRSQLIDACQANLSPIFGLYPDPGFHLNKLLNEHMAGEPILNIGDENETIHKLWRICNPEAIRKIQETLESRKIYIADGHHRYETALAYRNKRCKSETNFTGNESYNHIMIYLTDMDDSNLTILPAHRLVRRLSNGSPDGRKKRMEEFFSKKTCSSSGELSALMREYEGREIAFGMYDGDKLEFLILKEKRKYEQEVAMKVPEIYRFLDVTIAHHLLIDHILNGGEEMPEENIAYAKDAGKALELIDEKKFALAILLNPTRVDQVKAIASMGMRMPGKATYFYPKPLSGLVIHKFQ